MTEETNMTEQEMEEATNPFQINVDANGDGEVTEKELDSAVNELAEMESGQEDLENTMTEEQFNDITEDKTSEGAFLAATKDTIAASNESTSNALESIGEEAVMPKLDYPTKESLSKLIRPSANPNDLGHRQHWSIACQKFSDANNLHFLGFAIKDDEPMFKEKK